MQYNIKDILSILPNKSTSVLIDEILSINDRSILGLKKTLNSDFFFKGHFPKNPIMPGVIQIEIIAQVASVLVLSKKIRDNYLIYLLSIKSAKFHLIIRPNTVLTICCKLRKNIRRNVAFIDGIIYLNNKIATKASILIKILKNNTKLSV